MPVAMLGMQPQVDGLLETQFIALCEGTPIARVGVISMGLICASMRQLWVHPHYRHKGIGGYLVDLCLSVARKHQCETLNLSVTRGNRDVLPFYRKLSFSIAAEYDDGDLCLSRPVT